ncbi:MAG: transcription antitermination factor NusB [Cyclobacteriaceae bacterium]|nr:transcription antitermination factor NusB [Cyclobacteriaceae bacterium]
MQSLFAYEQCKEADYQIALEHIDAFFQPDLNSMKVQDKVLLKGQRTVALKQFENKFQQKPVKESSDPRINQAIDEAFTLNQKLVKKDFDFFRKNIVLEVEKINVFYLSVLNLVPALASIASHDKKIPTKNFSSNPLVSALKDNSDLKKESLKNGSGWDQKMDLVRGWFRDCVKPDKEFLQYANLATVELSDHKAFVKHLVRKIILGDTAINAHFEEEDLRWAEDHEIVKSMVDKTLKSLEEKSGVVEIQKLSLDWEEDKIFIEKLFVASTKLDKSYKELIANNTKNWEVDRLPLTDRVILEMALAELTDFPNIPVKVTINEYIELAKQYSTPKSRQFINGILDVISKDLKDSGKIKKSGRGLMDNK